MGVCVMGDQGTWGKVCVWGYSQHPRNPGEECGESSGKMQESFYLFIQEKFTIKALLWACP